MIWGLSLVREPIANATLPTTILDRISPPLNARFFPVVCLRQVEVQKASKLHAELMSHLEGKRTLELQVCQVKT